ncbi:CRISPR-associated helicase Cas3' [Corynebacterium falsenii]|uniref:CRISPR-associated helicase Cas3' n=1 Tax=Corynebacterium falsenii TaxID=108486 RepID=UPI00234C86A5|nr:CRISPR-associated helicase Cas3' [Corynebacterium falsenii]MDC7104169.1 CRISPR-associated helicase Cas3' [Corynebacterium falsenii]
MHDSSTFWAKFSRHDGRTLSVGQHSRDAADVINHVAQLLLPPSVLEGLQEDLGKVDVPLLLTTMAAVHDLGKISPYFQAKAPEPAARLDSTRFPMTVNRTSMRNAPHSLVSFLSFWEWMEHRGSTKLTRDARRGWKYILGGHHGVFPTDDSVRAARSELRLEPATWRQARFDFLDEIAERYDITAEIAQQFATLEWKPQHWVLLTGILITADWVASNEDYFPYDADDLEIDRLERALTLINLGHQWSPSSVTPEAFASRFGLPTGSSANSLQAAAIDVSQSTTAPSLHILESETGSGKTEAALAMAENLALTFGKSGIFFAQPTRVTSDAMFNRVKKWLESSPSGSPAPSFILAHGKAQFNSDFESIFTWGPRHTLPSEIYDEEPSDSGDLSSTPEAPQWFRGRKTSLLASITVGTIDQLLFGALSSKHIVLRHLGLVGKVVILDEIHAADQWMSVYLNRMLEWLGTYGVPVIALSATLPAAKRNELCAAYSKGVLSGTAAKKGLPAISTPEHGYPRITTVREAQPTTVFPKDDSHHAARTVEVSFRDEELAETASRLIEASAAGGCVAAICNTVSRAQELYECVTTQLPHTDADVVLLHSRFLSDHRFDRESDLVRLLGRHTAARPERLIVISTQIVEQGLDLDFDYMVSDLAPIDLLIQRIGRLHRHRNVDAVRPQTHKTARLDIIGSSIPDLDGEAPHFEPGLVAVYRKLPLLRTAATLQRHVKANGGLVTIPDDVEGLVSSTYTNHESPPAWREAYAAAEERERIFTERQHSGASHYLISPPSMKNLDSWSSALAPADEQLGCAQVRDADDSVEVVVVQRREGRVFALPHVEGLSDIPLDDLAGIDPPIAKRIAQCTVRLPSWSIRDEDIRILEEDGLDGWQHSRWLAGQLPMILDEDLSIELASTRFTYDLERGLLMGP